jgi:hypothetical protein
MVVWHMHENETVARHNCYHKDRCLDNDGLTAHFTSADEMPCPLAVKSIVDACRSLRADALAIELPEQTIVAVINAYDGTYAAATCEPDAYLSSIARGLQVRLYSGQCVESPGTFLPASGVHSALRHWELQIALVFGRQYAARLVSSAAADRGLGNMSIDDLEAIRRQLSTSIGGCIKLKAKQ